MADIHFWGGEKGGVGKSFACRTATDFHIDREIDFGLFDSDRTNPDVLKIYRDKVGARGAIFSESPRHADSANAIITTAVDDDRRVLVNLPGNSLRPLLSWMNKSSFVDIVEEAGGQFYYWFVCSGGFASLEMFSQTLAAFDPRVSLIFVKNFGMSEDWESFERDKALQKLIKQRGVKVMEFPAFIGNYHRNQIRKLGLSFLEAGEREDFKSVGRQRAKSFLSAAFAQFDSLGVFDVPPK
ncbi:MAG: hypothetical protein WA949_23680 [Phormidesmis sp.]